MRTRATPASSAAGEVTTILHKSATCNPRCADRLTLYDSIQGIRATQLTVAALLGLLPTKVRVITHFVGGAFGSKAMVWPHVTLAALAARQVQRPVKLALTREQMFTSCGHREEQEHQVALGASREGYLTALRHLKLSPTSPSTTGPSRPSAPTRKRMRARTTRTPTG